MKACCSGWSASPRASPSIVAIALPSIRTANARQAFTRLPSTCTVHAPHWPRPQPFLVPLRCRCSRSASSRVVRGSRVSACAWPLTVSVTGIMTELSLGAVLAASRLRSLRRDDGIDSGGEVNHAAGRCLTEALPAVDLAHGDLAGGARRPGQHGGGLLHPRRRQPT